MTQIRYTTVELFSIGTKQINLLHSDIWAAMKQLDIAKVTPSCRSGKYNQRHITMIVTARRPR